MGDQSIIKQVKKYKLVFIGDQSVGKTSIISRFINESFAGSMQVGSTKIIYFSYFVIYYLKIVDFPLFIIANLQFAFLLQPTVGIDFVAKTLHIDNKTIRLQLWDTAGQERFRSLIPSYIRDSDAAIIVYDISSMRFIICTSYL